MRGQKARGGGGWRGEEVLWEILDTGARGPVHSATSATVRVGGYREEGVGGTAVKVWMKTEMFRQTL